jgi:hypothetical protein
VEVKADHMSIAGYPQKIYDNRDCRTLDWPLVISTGAIDKDYKVDLNHVVRHSSC